jgi:hypothetical protein
MFKLTAQAIELIRAQISCQPIDCVEGLGNLFIAKFIEPGDSNGEFVKGSWIY